MECAALLPARLAEATAGGLLAVTMYNRHDGTFFFFFFFSFFFFLHISVSDGSARLLQVVDICCLGYRRFWVGIRLRKLMRGRTRNSNNKRLHHASIHPWQEVLRNRLVMIDSLGTILVLFKEGRSITDQTIKLSSITDCSLTLHRTYVQHRHVY